MGARRCFCRFVKNSLGRCGSNSGVWTRKFGLPGRSRLRPSFALDRLREFGPERLRYELTKPGPGGADSLLLTPVELIHRLAALVPPLRIHRCRCFGVLAPNAPLRTAVTGLAPPAARRQRGTRRRTGPSSCRPPTWALLLARIYEVFPLVCPRCRAEMRIIAFITDAPTVRDILDHLGEPTTPPRIATARGPPLWAAAGAAHDPAADPLLQSAPAFEFDQRLRW